MWRRRFAGKIDTMKIHVTQVFVDDQEKALQFYTEKLGFQLKDDVPVGEYRWLTVTEAGRPNSTELLLEPSNHPAVPVYKAALVQNGIPAHSFQVTDIRAEHKRLTDLGVAFTMPVTEAGEVTIAVLNDTCGNLIQLIEK